MNQSEFNLLAQKIAAELLNLRDTTSEDFKGEIANGNEASYYLNGRVDKKDVDALLAYQPTPNTTPQHKTNTTAIDAAYRTAAKKQWERDGELEIDDNAVVSIGDDPGAYVAAWVWVADSTKDTTTTQEKDNLP